MTVAQGTLMRNARLAAFYMGLVAIPVVFGLAAVIFGFGVSSAADYAVVIVVGLGGSWLIFRIGRAGLRVSEEGAVITSPVKRRMAVPLDSISAFEVDWRDPQWRWESEKVTIYPCVVLRRLDGGVLQIWSLAVEGLAFRNEAHTSRLQAMCDGLNELVSDLRGSADATRPPAV